jgi:hypothetical protein
MRGVCQWSKGGATGGKGSPCLLLPACMMRLLHGCAADMAAGLPASGLAPSVSPMTASGDGHQ